jgi:mRNA interferase RelE/StbE
VDKFFRLSVPPEVAETIRSLHPEVRRPVRAALDEIVGNPECGEPLRDELAPYWKYRVRRFRISYAIEKKSRTIRLMDVAHRAEVYEELAARLKKGTS